MHKDRLNKPKFVLPEIEAKLRALAERQQDMSGFLEKKPYCEVCGKTKNLVIHEITYSPLESITLCRSCHSTLHLRFLHFKRVSPRTEKQKGKT